MLDEIVDGVAEGVTEEVLDGVAESLSHPSPLTLFAARARGRFWLGLTLFPLTGMARAVSSAFTNEDSRLPFFVTTFGFAAASLCFLTSLASAIRAIGPARAGRWKLFDTSKEDAPLAPAGRAWLSLAAAVGASLLTLSFALG